MSPIQVVPKKTGIIVIHNPDGELVPTCVQNGWRVCVDYRKLNSSTRKYHFLLPFINQMLERLAGRSHFFCLDGYSGFHQIPVAPEDEENTTFTYPSAPLPTEGCRLDFVMPLPPFRGVWSVYFQMM